MSAQDRGWGKPCPDTKLETIYVGGIKLRVHQIVAPIMGGFVDEIVERGYQVQNIADDWGYACRKIAGSNSWSNHAWGLAIDLNATTNPMGRKLVTDMPQWVIESSAKWGLAWGGNYKTLKDAMHFEFMGTPQDVGIILWKREQDLARLTPTLLDYRGNLWEELVEDVKPTTVTDGCAVPNGPGTWRCNARGDVLSLQGAPILKGLPDLNVSPNAPIMAMAAYSNTGAWLAGADGGIFALGDAPPINGYLNIVGHIVGASVDDGALVLIASEGHAYAYPYK